MEDFTEKALDRGLSIVDKALLVVTPDCIVTMTEELVEVAFYTDWSGTEKFDWVLEQVKPMMSWFIREFGKMLVQLVYEIVKESRLSNGN